MQVNEAIENGFEFQKKNPLGVVIQTKHDNSLHLWLTQFKGKFSTLNSNSYTLSGKELNHQISYKIEYKLSLRWTRKTINYCA